ncbi:hypothetical protein ACVIOG_003888 [Rhizobium leguminosarum]
MGNKAPSLLRKPECRYCGRQWSPPRYVSSNLAFCEECRPERLALAAAKTKGLRKVIGPTGEIAMVPLKA